MSPELNSELCKTYAVLLNKQRIKCGDGWYSLIDTICSLTLGHGNAAPIAYQICEEDGTLRVDMRGGNASTRAYVEFAELLSASICELCGRPGALEKNPNSGRMQTRCGTCDAEGHVVGRGKNAGLEQVSELDAILEATLLAGLDVKIERGLSSVALTVGDRRWILRDDAELGVMLALYLGADAQRAWLARRGPPDFGSPP